MCALATATLHSIRAILPGGELILSTWQGYEISDLSYDKLVCSDDPGSVVLDEVSGVSDNINRQLVSTRRGLEAATRPYCLKIRTDILLENADFLKEFGKWDALVPPLHVMNRILICNYYTRNPRVYPLPFHPSDWVLFGRTEDLKKYFSAPLEEASEIQWFKTHVRTRKGFYTNLLARYVPEQYLCINFLKHFEPVHCLCFDDASLQNIVQTEQMLAGDFVVLDYQKQFGISFTKYHPNRYLEKCSLVSHRYWQRLFQEYCLGHTQLRWVKLLWCWLLRKGFSLRSLALQLLHKLHLKEKVKHILNNVH